MGALHIDLDESLVTIECLKKRKRGIYIQTLSPPRFISLLKKDLLNKDTKKRIWQFSRRTALRYLAKIMASADIIARKLVQKDFVTVLIFNAFRKIFH